MARWKKKKPYAEIGRMLARAAWDKTSPDAVTLRTGTHVQKIALLKNYIRDDQFGSGQDQIQRVSVREDAEHEINLILPYYRTEPDYTDDKKMEEVGRFVIQGCGK
jgi:hypothetical protein